MYLAHTSQKDNRTKSLPSGFQRYYKSALFINFTFLVLKSLSFIRLLLFTQNNLTSFQIAT